MDKFKQQIQKRLIANIIMDKCAQSDYLIFRDAWCTQDRVLRFTTPFFRKLFLIEEKEFGKWKTGDCVMYEVDNGAGSVIVNCVLSLNSISRTCISQRDALLDVLGIKILRNSNEIILRRWDLSQTDSDTNKLFEDFDHLIDKEILYFEQDLQEKLSSNMPQIVELHEGAVECVTLNKYERNQKARNECIAAHGTACTVCGIDFGKVYGPEFEGKIEVHHIVPISEIAEDYVVDPIKDLIPVCPNCHTALHSKKDGVYTVDEILKKKKEATANKG